MVLCSLSYAKRFESTYSESVCPQLSTGNQMFRRRNEIQSVKAHGFLITSVRHETTAVYLSRPRSPHAKLTYNCIKMFPRPCYITGIFPFSSKSTYRFYKNPWFSRYFPFFTVKKIFLLKNKVIFGISAWNCVRWCMPQYIFEQKHFFEKMRVRVAPQVFFVENIFFKKMLYFLEGAFMSDIQSLLSKRNPFPSIKVTCPPA